MHHIEVASSDLARVEVEHRNTDNDGHFVMIYLWSGGQVAASASLMLRGEYISPKAAEAISAAVGAALRDHWTA